VQPVDLGLRRPRLPVQAPGEGGEPGRVAVLVGGKQFGADRVEFIARHRETPSLSSQSPADARRQQRIRIPNSYSWPTSRRGTSVIGVIAAAGLAAAGLFIAVGLVWTARLLRIGALDALELAQKLGAPEPDSALDWPELRVVAAVAPDLPGDPHEALVLVDWPAHAERVSTLLVDLVFQGGRPARLLEQWCAERASVSPTRVEGDEFVLRRRRSTERVRCRLLAEDCCVPAEDSGRA
jgi:hypothetical protein